MKKFADEDDVIDALPVSELKKSIGKFDIVLVGPQVRYKMGVIEALAKEYNIVTALIDMKSYGEMNGKAVMQQAQDLFKK